MSEEEAIKRGHALVIYEDSEMSDSESHSLDDLWQSIYDIAQVADYGIVEEEPEVLEEAISWLKETQPLTDQYQDTDIYFGGRNDH